MAEALTAAPEPRRFWIFTLSRGEQVVTWATLLCVGALLFARLGTYALWDDEANTSLFGLGVWNTGDTSAQIGDNVVGYRSGLELKGLKNRLIAPLQYYVVAPFVGLGHRDPFFSRLPFVLLALGAVKLAFYWLKKEKAALHLWVMVGLGIIGNVSWLLYQRQGRYYGLSTFLTVLTLYLYLHQDGRWRKVAALAFSAVALLSTHYIAYAGLGLALGIDYLAFGLFGPNKSALRPKHLPLVVGVQALIGGAVIWVWNPLQKPVTGYVPASWVHDKVTLWWWNLRELNVCEFGVGVLLVLGPVLFLATRFKHWPLLRLSLGVIVYAMGAAGGSPQPVGWAQFADIRYMQGSIAAMILLAVLFLDALPKLPAALKVVLALPLFFTSAVHHYSAKWFTNGMVPELRSTFVAYLGELRTPNVSPYRDAADWLNQNAKAGETAVVIPSFAVYPLMFHAGHVTYGWQFDPSARAEYSMLPPIHFTGAELPTYFVAFGGEVNPVRNTVNQLTAQGYAYEQVAWLPVHWPDLTRPEFFWRSFVPLPVGAPNDDGVTIFRRR